MKMRFVFAIVQIAVIVGPRALCGEELVALPLDDSLRGTVAGKAATGKAVGKVTFVEAREGKGARLEGNGRVELAIGPIWPVREGCAEFWIQPLFTGGDKSRHWLLCDNLMRFRLFKYDNGQLYFQVRCDDRGVNCAARCTWLPGKWHHVAVAWRNFNSGQDDGLMMLYVDGQLVATAAGNFHVSEVGQTLILGSKPQGEDGAHAVISDVRVRDVPKTGYRPKPGEIAAHNPDDYALAALGASVRVSSEIKSFRGKAYLGTELIDGREGGGYWCTDFPHGAQAPHWAEIDLGEERLVGQVILYMVKRETTLLEKFRIEAWGDGEWRVLAKADDYRSQLAAGGAQARYAAPFGIFLANVDPPVNTQRIRIVIDSPGVARLHEVEVLPPAKPPERRTVHLAEAGPVLRFDFGSTSSPVEYGWIPVSEKTAYTPETGYGWQGGGRLFGVDRYDGYALTRDLVAGVSEGERTQDVFSVNLADGRYAVAAVAGDVAYAISPFQIAANGKVVAPRVGTGGAGGCDGQTFVTDVKDGRLDLCFEAEDAWAIAAVIVAPEEHFAEVQALVEHVEELFAKGSPGLLQGLVEHRSEEAEGNMSINESRRATGYAVFSRPYVRQVFPTTVPNEGEVAREIKMAATPGEREPATVAIRAFKPLRDVRIVVSDLVGQGGAIPAAQVDIKVVRCWPQREEKWQEGEYMVVPELLEPQGRHGELWVRPNTTKQFWVTIPVPEGTRPGTYRGTLGVTAANARRTDVALVVEVLPFRLREPQPMALGIYYYPRPERGEDLVLGDLRDMRAHGLNAIAFPVGKEGLVLGSEGFLFDLSHVRWVMGLLNQVGGFEGPFPLWMGRSSLGGEFTAEKREALKAFVRAVEAERGKFGWPELLYYPVDEPFRGERLREAIPRYKACKEVPDIRTYCTVSAEAADTLAPWLDVRCHTVTAVNGFVWPDVWESAVRDGDEFWWYSNSTRHYPDVMRMKAGFFHWKVRATGQTYWHFRAPVGAPFCDFDGTARDHITAYPGLDGPIDTIQWECQREGIDDAKYAWTLELLAQEAEKEGAPAAAVAQARRVLNELQANINVDMAYYDKKYQPRKYAFHYYCEWQPEDFDCERSRLASAIVELMKVME